MTLVRIENGQDKLRQDVRTCFYWGKPCHIVRFYYKIRKEERKYAKNAKEEDKIPFTIHHRAHLMNICKWIMNLEATKYMSSHRAAFHTYEVMFPCNVHLGDNSVAKAIGMGSIVIGVQTRGIRNRVCIMGVLHVPKLHANLLSMRKF